MADDPDSEDDAVMLALYLLVLRRRRRRQKRKHKWWVQPRLDKRELIGAVEMLPKEISVVKVDEPGYFLRMEPRHFDFVQQRVADLLPDRQDTFMRKCLTKAERIEVTLGFLASGDTYTNLSYRYSISRQTLGRIIPETCEAICRALADYLKAPNSADDWTAIAKDFERVCHFPNCIGALEGKHITLKTPNNSGPSFYNTKHFHSLILLAVVDARHRFTMFDIGVNARDSDLGLFSSSPIAAMLQDSTNHIPPPKTPASWPTGLPHVLVGRDVFPLKPYLMKPYPQRGLTAEEGVFNDRLRKATRVADEALGILVNHFAIVGKQMPVNPHIATVVVQACIALHNFLTTDGDACYAETVQREVQAEWCKDLGLQSGNRSANIAQSVRNEFRDYFLSEGAVSW